MMMAEARGFESAVIEAIVSQIDPFTDAVAAQQGMPPGAKRYTRQEEIDEWNYSPISDPQERMNKALEMHVQGATPETITDFLYPNVRRLIGAGRTRPDEQIRFAREMRQAAGWPDAPPQLDDTGLPLEMQVGMAQAQPQQQPMMQPAPAPMPAPTPPPAPMPMPASPPMQQQPAPPPMGANPLMGLGG